MGNEEKYFIERQASRIASFFSGVSDLARFRSEPREVKSLDELRKDLGVSKGEYGKNLEETKNQVLDALRKNNQGVEINEPPATQKNGQLAFESVPISHEIAPKGLNLMTWAQDGQQQLENLKQNNNPEYEQFARKYKPYQPRGFGRTSLAILKMMKHPLFIFGVGLGVSWPILFVSYHWEDLEHMRRVLNTPIILSREESKAKYAEISELYQQKFFSGSSDDDDEF